MEHLKASLQKIYRDKKDDNIAAVKIAYPNTVKP
jgi:hypothetical protein